MERDFNSHAPCGAQLTVSVVIAWIACISTHTPHAGRNAKMGDYQAACRSGFQLTRPMRGATNFNSQVHPTVAISTHTPHAGRNNRLQDLHHCLKIISTHTPHAGRNIIHLICYFSSISISTHTPHAGRNYKLLKKTA